MGEGHIVDVNSRRSWGGIEAGGTKFVCAVGAGSDELHAIVEFPTTTPVETFDRAISFFRDQNEPRTLEAVGIAAFGPLDLDPSSPTFGFITSTPKPGWSDTDLAGVIGRALEVPVRIDIDVNGAALGEFRWGAARELDTFVYLTIGTGIGGGGMARGKLLHGLIHPEMGHVRIPHDLERDPFPGACPYHGDCLEGLATGPALEKRWGRRAEELPPDHPAWELEAHYLALAVTNIILTFSPQRVIMGGGVMEQTQLYTLIRREVLELLNGYVLSPKILDDIEGFIVPPGLGNRSGVLGAIALAQSPDTSS